LFIINGDSTQYTDDMALTRCFKQTITERAPRDPEFARALLDEAATLFLSGEPKIARTILRDLVTRPFSLLPAVAKPAARRR
jgi:hypothetical protein